VEISKRQEEIVQQTLQHAVEAVRSIPNSALASFLPHLKLAQEALIKDLKAWEMKQDGAARYTAHVKRSALAQLEAAMAEIEALAPTMYNTLLSSGMKAGEAGLTAMEKQLSSLNAMFEGSMVPVSFDRAAILSGGEKLLLNKYPSSAARYAGKIRDDVRRHLAVGTLQQKSISEMATKMYEEIPHVFKNAKFNAMRLVRTEVMNSYNEMHLQGLQEAHEEDSDVKMRWDASYDFRRCPECGSLDGKIVEVDKEFTASWSTASGAAKQRTHRRPPAHPQCRCVLVPWIDDWPDTDWNTEPPEDGVAPDATYVFGKGAHEVPKSILEQEKKEEEAKKLAAKKAAEAKAKQLAEAKAKKLAAEKAAAEKAATEKAKAEALAKKKAAEEKAKAKKKAAALAAKKAAEAAAKKAAAEAKKKAEAAKKKAAAALAKAKKAEEAAAKKKAAAEAKAKLEAEKAAAAKKAKLSAAAKKAAATKAAAKKSMEAADKNLAKMGAPALKGKITVGKKKIAELEAKIAGKGGNKYELNKALKKEVELKALAEKHLAVKLAAKADAKPKPKSKAKPAVAPSSWSPKKVEGMKQFVEAGKSYQQKSEYLSYWPTGDEVNKAYEIWGNGKKPPGYKAELVGKGPTGSYKKTGPYTPPDGKKVAYDDGKKRLKQANAIGLRDLKSDSRKMINAASVQQQGSLRAYTGAAYRPINQGLRNGTLDQNDTAKRHVKKLDEFYKTARLKEDHVVYRGVSFRGDFKAPEVGALWEEKGYSSTSISKAGKFGGNGYLTIELPTGTPGVYVESISSYTSEKELLLDRGARFRVISKEVKGGVTHIRLRVESTETTRKLKEELP